MMSMNTRPQFLPVINMNMSESKCCNLSELFPSVNTTLELINPEYISTTNSNLQSTPRAIEFCKRTVIYLCIIAAISCCLVLLYDLYVRWSNTRRDFRPTLPRVVRSICHLFSDSAPDSYGPEVRDVHIIQVTNPVLFIIGNLGSDVDIKQLDRCLKQKKKAGCSPSNGINCVTAAVDKKTGIYKGQAIVAVSRTELHASGLLCQSKINHNGQEISVTELGHRKLLQFKGVEWQSINGSRQTTKELLKVLNIRSQFGYSMVDGGWYLLKCGLHESKDIKQVIEDCARKGFHRVVVKTDSLQQSQDVLDWCRNFKHFLFVIAELDLEKDDVEWNSCMDKLKKLITSPYCVAIGNLPLCYHGEKTIKQLHNFRKIIRFACHKKKPLTFSLSPKDKTHKHFLEVLQDHKQELPRCCIEVADCSSGYLDVQNLINEFGFYVYVNGPSVYSMNHMTSLIQSKVVPIENIILCSNDPHEQFINNKKCYSYEHFQQIFLKSQMKYMHKESIDNIKYQSPVVLHCILELLSALVDVPPLKLVKQLNRNAECFYQFP